MAVLGKFCFFKDYINFQNIKNNPYQTFLFIFGSKIVLYANVTLHTD